MVYPSITKLVRFPQDQDNLKKNFSSSSADNLGRNNMTDKTHAITFSCRPLYIQSRARSKANKTHIRAKIFCEKKLCDSTIYVWETRST